MDRYYIVLSSSPSIHSLAGPVNEFLARYKKENWVPIGQPFKDGDRCWCQAMFIPE